MARPTKYDDETVKRILDRLRAGSTRRAACLAAGISEDTFANWLKGFSDFSDAVATTEAECEVRNTAMIEKAAFGYDATRTTRTVRTVVKPRKLRFPKGGTVKTNHPDGRVTTTRYPPGASVEEPVALEELSETTTVAFEFDWHAALEYLKRRSRLDWGDNVQIDWKKLSSEQILEILMRTIPVESIPAGSVSAAGAAGEGRGGGAEAGDQPAGAGR